MSKGSDWPAAFAPTDEVRAALQDGGPLVGLETSVLAQGLPSPHNLHAAHALDRAVRGAGAIPAWTAVHRGAIRVGLSAADLEQLCDPATGASKVARRDYPAALTNSGWGSTTVSATLWAASTLGIEVVATGGIGGVHRATGDVSADLLELARLPGLVVCAGPKSIVDPAATLERLEELSVLVVGYRCDRLPFFVSTDAGISLEHRVDTPEAAAALAGARRALAVDSAILLCQPIDPEHALEPSRVTRAVDECERRAIASGITGKAVTPFLLSCLADVTGGDSLRANLALLTANARLAGDIAVHLSQPDVLPDEDS